MTLPLAGRRILVSRPAAQAGTLAALIAANGGEALCFPLLEIGPADDRQPLEQAIEALDDYALVIFISPNAVDFSLPEILARRAWPATLRVAAIGQGTARALAGHGIGEVIVPAERFESEALLEMPPLAAESVAGRRVLILRGNGGRELLAETLGARGARVDCVSCYRRSPPSSAEPLQSWLRAGRLDALTVSASEGLRYLPGLLGDDFARLAGLPVFVPHPRIAAAAAGLGLSSVVTTAPADAGIIAGLCAYNWACHER